MARLTQLSRSVQGRVVLITGAGGGQGRATAHLFADEGAHVAVTDLGQTQVDAVVSEITENGGSASGWIMDVANSERVAQVTDEVAARFGGIDYLVNNAGISRSAPIDSENFEDEWAISLEVLLTAHTRTIRACLPYLRKSDAARIVNIASTEGWGATKFLAPYTAAKHGVIGLTRALSLELAPLGITVNAICPGYISDVGMAWRGWELRSNQEGGSAETIGEKFALDNIPLGRLQTAEDIARSAVFLASIDAKEITGAALNVGGGVVMD